MPTLGSKLDVKIWLPQFIKDQPKIQSKAANERPTEGIITVCKPNKNKNLAHQPIAKVESRKTLTHKFGNRGSADGGNWCLQHTDAVGDSVKKVTAHGRGNRGGDDSDADGWDERREATKFRAKVRNLVAKSPHFNKIADAIPVLDSPESGRTQHSPGLVGDSGVLWHNWKQELVDSNQIDWREEILKADEDEGSLIPEDSQEAYLNALADTGKLPRDMTREEILDNWQDVSKAKVKEITGLYDLGCFKRCPRHISKNIIDARWAIIWKMIDGAVGVKCRFIVRGFKDMFQDFDTYVGTTSRSGQRLVNAVAAEYKELLLVSFDVSQAFAKGLIFEELSAFTGQDIRKVEFDVPKVDIDSLRELLDFKDFDPKYETLTMLKPIYGLKDAPRAWRKKLHGVLIGWLSCRQLYSEPELYCVHRTDGTCGDNSPKRAQQHNEEQQETGKMQVAAQEYTRGNLQCLLSVHVDDTKGCATEDVADGLLKHLSDKVGQCKADCISFLHTGIQHESAPGSIFTHQYVYIDSIEPIDVHSFQGKDEDSLCDIAMHDAYRSVLGAVAWTVLTRAELAAYVQALQRRAHAPRIKFSNA